MLRQFTLVFCLFFCGFFNVLSAQLFIEVGGTGQLLRIKRNESPSISAMAKLISISGGDPNRTLPPVIVSTTISPKISVGYRLPFDDFNMMITVGTSQDLGNSFRLRGSAAVNGKTYPYPECFSARLRGFKTLKNGLSFGGDLAFDNQKSEMILNNSNITPEVRGLMNQISSEMNLLGAGATQTMQVNALVGWQKTHDEFEFDIFALVGMVGKALGGQLDIKVRYYFGER